MSGNGPPPMPESHVMVHLAREVVGCESVLDIGSGLGAYIGCGPPFRAALDAHAPYLALVDAAIKLQGRAQDILPRLRQRSFDAVICIDVIEHLDKAEGVALLAELARVAAKIVVVFTPLGFHPQEGDAWGLGGEHWQRHRSGWTEADFPRPWQPLAWPAFSHGKPDLPLGALWATCRPNQVMV